MAANSSTPRISLASTSALEIRRAFASSPNVRITLSSCSLGREFTTSNAVISCLGSKRISSGASLLKLNPLDSPSSCSDERPRSNRTPSTGSKSWCLSKSPKLVKFSLTIDTCRPHFLNRPLAISTASGSASIPST